MPERTQQWPSDLVLVRHGESRRNVQTRLAHQLGLTEYGDGLRQADIPLTATGIRQAEETGQYLARFHFYRVVVSPYLRAVQTAELITRQFPYQAEVRYEERVREREVGIFDALTRTGIAHKYPEELARWEREGRYYYRAPGGESFPDVNLRIHSFLGSIRNYYRNKPVLVVTHGNAIWSFRRVIERMTERDLVAKLEATEFAIPNCSVTWYSYDPELGRLTLREFARVHYRKQDATNAPAGHHE
jgi:broad specificity phosphatase PhoE